VILCICLSPALVDVAYRVAELDCAAQRDGSPVHELDAVR
jgi:hypothetical protein